MMKREESFQLHIQKKSMNGDMRLLIGDFEVFFMAIPFSIKAI